MAQIIAEMRLDSESIQAALLHDCIEDTDSTYDDIAKRFGATVADLVDGVTKLTGCSTPPWKRSRWRISGRCSSP